MLDRFLLESTDEDPKGKSVSNAPRPRVALMRKDESVGRNKFRRPLILLNLKRPPGANELLKFTSPLTELTLTFWWETCLSIMSPPTVPASRLSTVVCGLTPSTSIEPPME